MKLVFSNNIYIDVLAYILLPTLIFYKCKFNFKFRISEDYFSKLSTDAMRGICILLIMLHHISQRLVNVGLLWPFRFVGYLAVTIFLFFSGYGLMKSYMVKKNYLRNFIINKVGRIYITFFIINLLSIIFYDMFFAGKYNLKDLILNSITIKFAPFNFAMWYAIVIMIFYIVFYSAFKIFNNEIGIKLIGVSTIIYLLICISLNLGVWWYNSCFGFVIGVIWAYKKIDIDQFILKRFWLSFSMSLVGFCMTFILYTRTAGRLSLMFNLMSSIMFIFLVVQFMFLFRVKSNALAYLGNISYEMYLIHVLLLDAYFNHVQIKESFSVYIFVILTILLSIAINLLIKPIFKNGRHLQRSTKFLNNI